MGEMLLPGFRFCPTDVELVCYYLKRKIMGKPIRSVAISEIELYKFAPWDLPGKSRLQSKDLEWYFFCHGDRKYANGSRRNRATDNGYWKTTGKDISISHNFQSVAMRRTLVFYLGKATKGVRTDWVMHEYRSVDKKLADSGFLLDAYVVCKIFKKSGPGPKNGEQYGAPFKEEEWEDDEVNESSVLIPPMCDGSLNLQHNLLDDTLQSDTHAVGNFGHYSSECFSVNRLSQELLENNNSDSPNVQENNGAEIPGSFISHGTVANEMNIDDGSGTYDGLEDLSTQPELDTADSIYFSNNMKEYTLQNALLKLSNQVESEALCDIHSSSNVVEEHILYSTQLRNDDGAYMEMEDFLFPMERNCSELVDPGNMFGHNSCFQNLRGTSVPAHLNIVASSSGMEGPSGNIAGQNMVDFPGPSVCETTDENGSTKSIQSSIGVSNRNETSPSGGGM